MAELFLVNGVDVNVDKYENFYFIFMFVVLLGILY